MITVHVPTTATQTEAPMPEHPAQPTTDPVPIRTDPDRIADIERENDALIIANGHLKDHIEAVERSAERDRLMSAVWAACMTAICGAVLLALIHDGFAKLFRRTVVRHD